MITPTKGVAPDRALLAVGARVLPLLDEPRSVTRVWALFREREAARGARTRVSFEWFTLTLDLLYALGLVDLRRGLLVAVRAEEEDGDAA
ncbi:ABC-three component system middle component 6 [Streptomyces iconiensis]|uniref:Uncharacterized protein n=1 Tax=Streptomyces iconiensis TaxID=1384038 RepID=A0ABT7A058_9ACTN|nr:ABC-three component system middle component 6 [Streptomyces iconiensis]MDJ1134686.1 hypothetical protein [Streptomyces iconiensis]